MSSSLAPLFKGLPHVALLSNQGSSPLAQWSVVASTGRPLSDQLSHHVKRVYERDLKGYCIHVASQSIKLEYACKGASHPYLALQIWVPHDCKKLTIELGVVDVMGSTKASSKRRLFLSTVTKEPKTTPLHALIPIDSLIPRDTWTTLLIDLNDIISSLYRNCTFRTLDFISIQGDNIKLRTVLTLKDVLASSPTPSSTVPGTPTSEIAAEATTRADLFFQHVTAGELDTNVFPKQFAFPYTLASPAWTLVRGTPAKCTQLATRMKKTDSGMSIAETPTTGAAPADPAVAHLHAALARIDLASRRRGGLSRMNSNTSVGSGIPLPPPAAASAVTTAAAPPAALPAGWGPRVRSRPPSSGIPPPSVAARRSPAATAATGRIALAPLAHAPAVPRISPVAAVTPPVPPARDDEFDREVMLVVRHATAKRGASAGSVRSQWSAHAPAATAAAAAGGGHVPLAADEYESEPEVMDDEDGDDVDAVGLSPHKTIQTRTADAVESDEESVELVFDAQLNCYYDPATGKYYNVMGDEAEGVVGGTVV
ncbi:hypothetical protein GGF32_004887 [Allomyces javanicus]|nr:hypothetical protein GGF32_004887 [Allomyces javanicus]